jgi:hypothetical protein
VLLWNIHCVARRTAPTCHRLHHDVSYSTYQSLKAVHKAIDIYQLFLVFSLQSHRNLHKVFYLKASVRHTRNCVTCTHSSVVLRHYGLLTASLNTLRFVRRSLSYGGESLAPRLNAKLVDHPLSAICYCLYPISLLAPTTHYISPSSVTPNTAAGLPTSSCRNVVGLHCDKNRPNVVVD